MPDLAARPAWSGFAIVPNWLMKPAAIEVASETACAACCASSLSRRAQAAAAPIAPTVAVACQPRLRWTGFTPWPTRPRIWRPDDIGIEALPARCAFLFGKGEDRGDEDGAGMGLGGIEIVVEIERVRGGAVDQRGPGGGEGGVPCRLRWPRRSPRARLSSNTLRVTGSAAPGMATPIVSMKARCAASQAAWGQSAGVSASQCP